MGERGKVYRNHPAKEVSLFICFTTDTAPNARLCPVLLRRVAAISVAQRTAEEVGCILGDEVGYTLSEGAARFAWS